MVDTNAHKERQFKLLPKCLCPASVTNGRLEFENVDGSSFWHLQCDKDICVRCLSNAILRLCHGEEK